MNIGRITRIWEIEPVQEPAPPLVAPEPEPAVAPEPVPQPEVPAQPVRSET